MQASSRSLSWDTRMKPFFGSQIIFYDLSGALIQMVCGLVDQQEIIFAREQNGEQNLCLFPETQCHKRAVKDLRILA